jgi:hypothetical protein
MLRTPDKCLEVRRHDMDWVTFASKAIDSLAWPAATIVLVVLLRHEIKKIIPYLKRIKAGPLEAEFERELEELKESIAEPTAIEREAVTDPASKEFLFHLAQLHPRSAVLESWVRVEAAARTVLAAKDPTSSTRRYIPAAKLAELLAQLDVLNSGQVSLFHKLRGLRNDVAHQENLVLTFDSASAYIDLAVFLQGWLEGHLK